MNIQLDLVGLLSFCKLRIFIGDGLPQQCCRQSDILFYQVYSNAHQIHSMLKGDHNMWVVGCAEQRVLRADLALRRIALHVSGCCTKRATYGVWIIVDAVILCGVFKLMRCIE
jgi:hypothetical protein